MNLIVSEIQKGNQKIFKAFFDKHYKDLVVYANSFLFDKDSSEDIVQDIFIYIWENASDLRIGVSFEGYIYTMTRNRCLNYLKSIKITDNLDVLAFNIHLITENTFDTVNEDDKKIIHYQILKIVDSLPDKMQQIVKLKFLNDYKYSEIATELNISVNTVKTQLKRAKIKISETLVIILILIQINR